MNEIADRLGTVSVVEMQRDTVSQQRRIDLMDENAATFYIPDTIPLQGFGAPPPATIKLLDNMKCEGRIGKLSIH